jgi:sugar lactone lactonase YvrE
MSLLTATPLFTLPVNNQLGENVLWDNKNNRILWTDIQASCLYIYNHTNKNTEIIHLHQRLASFGLTNKDNTLICAFESGFALLDLVTHQVTWLADIEKSNPGTRMNDGRVDRQGVFWAGTMVEDDNKATQKGALYSIDADFEVNQHLENLQISNSLCWSPDGKIMYFADSPTHQILAFDNTSEITAKSSYQLITQTRDDHFPDGSTVDKLGNIWNALWGSGMIVCYKPNGEIIFQVKLPVSQISCVCIGGPNLDWLIITSASQLTDFEKKKEPEAGNLFIYQLNQSIGLAESRFILR